MTLFEFVSVAFSLILALAVADNLRALIPASRSPARYWPHFVWLIAMMINIAYAWWSTWGTRDASWNGLLFLYVLINAALITIMTRLLTSHAPDSVSSFKEHFHANRQAFFAVLLAYAVNGFIASWIFNRTFPSIDALQMTALPGAVGATVGFFMRSDRGHIILSTIAVALLLAALAVSAVQN